MNNPINATNACPASTTIKYKFISTQQIIDTASASGFHTVSERVGRCLKPERQGFQRHNVVLTRPEWALANGDQLRLTVLNSHDGTGSLRLILGYFRLVCSNGLLVSQGQYTRAVSHMGNVSDKLTVAFNDLYGMAHDIVAMVDRFRSIQLSIDMIYQLTTDMIKVRIGDRTLDNVYPVPARRRADLSADLWTVFNRVQEQVVNGGATFKSEDKVVRLRKLTSIKSQVEVNQKLWDILVKYAA